MIVLDKNDRVVSYQEASSVTWLKPCKRCAALVEHHRIYKHDGKVEFVPLADHDSQCRP